MPKKRIQATKKKISRQAKAAEIKKLAEEQKSARKNRAVYSLISALILAILVTSGIRATAAQTVTSDRLEINIVQEDNILTAGVSEPLQVESWRAVSVGDDERCGQQHFTQSASLKRRNSFLLTADDIGQYYCFRARNTNQEYFYKMSDQILDYGTE